MKTRITVLSENSVIKPQGFIAEHGFAALVERGAERVLFDTGRGYALFQNARILGIDLASISKVVLSHGHYDHTGGLPELLRVGGERDIYAHPGIFSARYNDSGDGHRLAIGIPFTRAFLEGLGARFHLERQPIQVAEGILTTGEVPRITSFETGDANLCLAPEEGGGQDPHADDLSLIVDSEKGLLVLLGCAHAGLINILEHVHTLIPDRPVHAVMGGTHLGFSSEQQMTATLDRLRELGLERVGASHCTGLAGAARLQEALGDRFFFAGVGAVLEV